MTDRKLRKAAPGQTKMVTAKGNNAAKRTVDHLSQQGWQLNTDIMTACFTVWAILLFPVGLLLPSQEDARHDVYQIVSAFRAKRKR